MSSADGLEQGLVELAALHATSGDLPEYAAAFDPARYENPSYADSAASDTGQL